MARARMQCLFALATLPEAAAVIAAPSAQFDYVIYEGTPQAGTSSDTEYLNPILPGFHPDPSIARVGDDFFLVNSTFSYFPGLPVFRSSDLIHWRLIGNAIDRQSQLSFAGLGTNRGLFAPAITHHDGKFWIVNTCIECGGNFVITATDPAGPWSDPMWLNFAGIDPSLFFADDSSAWITYNDAPPGEPLYDGHRAIWLQRFDPETMQVHPERTLLVNGGLDLADEPVWAEGPHLYQHDGWYYLLAAEGGTADQHSQTVYRSRSITGPYEAGPINPILTQRDLPAHRPNRIEATGHADVVRLDDGTWWGVFLATRPFEAQSTLLGRETFLLPLRWDDGWPRFLDPGEAVPLTLHKPNLPTGKGDDWTSWRDEFSAPLGDEWIGIREPNSVQRVAVDSHKQALVLIPGAVTASGLQQPAFVGRRMRHHQASFETRVTFAPSQDEDFAGLLAFMDENHFVTFGIEGDRLTVRRKTDVADPASGRLLASMPRSADTIDLRLQFDGGSATAHWRQGATGRWKTMGEPIDVEPLASVHAGLFTGLVVGPYAVSP